MRTIWHLDMVAFYASVEQRNNPELRGKPVIVGSPPTQRGVVCASSYEARKYGVRSAMASAVAGRLCPSGIFISLDMNRYREESKCIMRLLTRTGAIIEQASVDEASLDLSSIYAGEDPDGCLRRSLIAARELKESIRNERQLTASIGIATNKLLAKLASGFQKPDGLTLISEAEKIQFLRPLPVRSLYGVGKVAAEQLNKAGIMTVGDIQDHAGDLRAFVGSFGPTLRKFAFGEDDRPLNLSDEVKSISSESTFLRDTEDRNVLRTTLREQAAEIADELLKKGLAALTVQVRLRYGDFTTLTRQTTLQDPIAAARSIYRRGCGLLPRHKLVNRPLRLIGLGVSNLMPPRQQLLLPLDRQTVPPP